MNISDLSQIVSYGKKLTINLRKTQPKNSWYTLFLLKIFLQSKTLMLDKYCGMYLALKIYCRKIGKKKKTLVISVLKQLPQTSVEMIHTSLSTKIGSYAF